MKKTFATAGLFLSFFAVGAFAESWTGTISDEHCGAKHTAATAKDIACAEKCANGGAAAVFVSGDKVYKIENQDAVKGHMGHKVTIDGKMEGDSIHVDSVKM